MAIETTYSHARANFAELWDRAVNDREHIIVHRRGSEDLALISAEELASMLETLYLLRSPENARRLKEAYADALEGITEPIDVEQLRRDLTSDGS